jgi:hypothetical protein
MENIKVKMIKLFIDRANYGFLCDYFIDVDEDTIYVHLHLNSKAFRMNDTRLLSKVREIKNKVKNDINSYLGIEVLVGNTIIDC